MPFFTLQLQKKVPAALYETNKRKLKPRTTIKYQPPPRVGALLTESGFRHLVFLVLITRSADKTRYGALSVSGFGERSQSKLCLMTDVQVHARYKYNRLLYIKVLNFIGVGCGYMHRSDSGVRCARLSRILFLFFYSSTSEIYVVLQIYRNLQLQCLVLFCLFLSLFCQKLSFVQSAGCRDRRASHEYLSSTWSWILRTGDSVLTADLTAGDSEIM